MYIFYPTNLIYTDDIIIYNLCNHSNQNYPMFKITYLLSLALLIFFREAYAEVKINDNGENRFFLFLNNIHI